MSERKINLRKRRVLQEKIEQPDAGMEPEIAQTTSGYTQDAITAMSRLAQFAGIGSIGRGFVGHARRAATAQADAEEAVSDNFAVRTTNIAEYARPTGGVLPREYLMPEPLTGTEVRVSAERHERTEEIRFVVDAHVRQTLSVPAQRMLGSNVASEEYAMRIVDEVVEGIRRHVYGEVRRQVGQALGLRL